MKSVLVPKGCNPGSDAEAMLLSLLHERTACNEEFRDFGYWINIGSDELRQIVGRNYCTAVKAAGAAGWIEVNRRYSTGRSPSRADAFSKSYRLTRKYRGPHFDEHRLKRARPFKSRIRIQDGDRIGMQLVRCLRTVTLPQNPALTAWDRYLASRIQTGQFYATRCRYGRFHSTFTGLSKVARQHLKTLCGAPLIEVDVSCCQLLLIWVMAARRKSLEERRSFARNYRTCCELGTLYDLLLERCAGMTKGELMPGKDEATAMEPVDRTSVKKALIVMTFERLKRMKQCPIFRVMTDLFPEITEFMCHRKRSNYKQLARSCQKLESRIMIDQVCSDVLRAYPEATLITVHDSILCTPQHLTFVEQCIKARFLENGVSVNLKRTEPNLK